MSGTSSFQPMDETRKPTIPEVLPLLREYVATPGNGVGGSLHIVLADGNVADHHVRFCLEQAKAKGDSKGVELAELLLRMSKTQRIRLGDLMP